MTAEGVAVDGSKAAVDRPKLQLSTELLPEDALERSKVGNPFEKKKCEKPGDIMFTEVRGRETAVVGHAVTAAVYVPRGFTTAVYVHSLAPICFSGGLQQLKEPSYSGGWSHQG